MKNKQKITIFDTTLRDGQQAPSAGMSMQDNLYYAALANDLNIDVLEAGFPAASKNNHETVNKICKFVVDTNSPMTIAALCQLKELQLDLTMDALAPSAKVNKARIHTYLPVDPNLMQASLGTNSPYHKLPGELARLVGIAVTAGYEVQFSPEGYSKLGDNFDFVSDLFRAAITAGATIINFPDTIGGVSRWDSHNEFFENIKKHKQLITDEFPDSSLIYSVHCHNDLGLALDNTMNAVLSGLVTQIEGCINGVGERAGNVALEQCILMLKKFGNQVDKQYFTNINMEKLVVISNFVSQNMMARQKNWPITGDNIAMHSSGGHTNAILKNPEAYQPFAPELVGKQIEFLFGPFSGSNHLQNILQKYDIVLPDKNKAKITQALKDMLANHYKGVSDEELVEAYQHLKKSMPNQFSHNRRKRST